MVALKKRFGSDRSNTGSAIDFKKAKKHRWSAVDYGVHCAVSKVEEEANYIISCLKNSGGRERKNKKTQEEKLRRDFEKI